MLYSEFVAGTGCRENDHNYEVYRKLEILYMNDEATTKEDVYEWGKKLVDNSPSSEELAKVEEWKTYIEEYKNRIKEEKLSVARYHLYALEAENKEDKKLYKSWEQEGKRSIKLWNSEIQKFKNLIESVQF